MPKVEFLMRTSTNPWEFWLPNPQSVILKPLNRDGSSQNGSQNNPAQDCTSLSLSDINSSRSCNNLTKTKHFACDWFNVDCLGHCGVQTRYLSSPCSYNAMSWCTCALALGFLWCVGEDQQHGVMPAFAFVKFWTLPAWSRAYTNSSQHTEAAFAPDGLGVGKLSQLRGHSWLPSAEWARAAFHKVGWWPFQQKHMGASESICSWPAWPGGRLMLKHPIQHWWMLTWECS